MSHATPTSYEKLKDTLQKAQEGDNITILKSGSTYPKWMNESEHKENITIVDCSSLKVEVNILNVQICFYIWQLKNSLIMFINKNA